LLDELEALLGIVDAMPRAFARVTRSRARRAVMRRFPYVIVFREVGTDERQVIAFAHVRRRAKYWSRRV
jgi:hypothetical protein